MTEIQKKKMIKLIHTQKTRAGINNEAYVRILMDAANVQSSLSLQTMPQFSAVIAALNNLLVSQGQAPLGGPAQRVHRDVYPLVNRAERVFGSDADKRLGGFIHKLGKDSVNDLSPLEIRKCHGFLTRIEQGVR
jgi:hypothetical protein